jgi:uncharacterized repeat protein (TIGR01451 family)
MRTSAVWRVLEDMAGGARRAGLLALALASAAAPLAAQGLHGTPGKDGPGGVLTGVVNTYFPGTTAALAAGATTITLGAASGAAVGIAPGDLLLVIQVQDADINSANTSNYGAGTGTGAGYTALNSAGSYEYVTALSTVGTGGGTVTIRGAGPGNGLVNAYRNAAYGAAGQRRYQVIRVPQYSSATLSSGLTAAAWDGARGGILAIDVAGQLTLGGTVSVNGLGFRGGAGRGLTGAAGGTNTDYRNLATLAFHGMKGEGIAGTPWYVIDQVTGLQVDNGVEGYPNGSSAQGAPGNAGGGGTDGNTPANDQNSGGGGGGNAGAGGRGGNTWSSNLPVGGRGGAVVPGSASLLSLGGGGGAGSRNNSSGTASSGGAGGGMVFLRAGTVSGTGTITANGQNGNAPANDGGGGGGAGGTVVVFAASGPLTGLAVQARGGNGGNADVGGAAHGPGGGGGGGLVVLSSAAATDVIGGQPGYTVTVGNLYNATAGAPGVVITTLTAPVMPGTPPGALTAPSLTVTKTTSTPTVTNGPSGVAVTYTITVANAADRDTARSVSLLDTLPAGFVFASTQAPVLAGGASRSPSTDPAAGDPIPAWSTFTIPGGGSVSVTFDAAVAVGVNGAFQNPAIAAYLDPGRTTVNGQTSAAYDPASSTGEDVTVQPDPSTGTVTGTVFNDANGNGSQDGGETGIAGVTVSVTVGAVARSGTTDASGGWAAGAVPPGTATVDVDDTTLPAGLVRTAGADPTSVAVTAGATVSAGAVGYQARADVQVTKLAPAQARRNRVLDYLIVTTNTGPAQATVVVTDSLPSVAAPNEVTFQSASRGATQTGRLVTWPAITLDSGETIVDTVTVVVRAAVGSTITNVARAASGVTDPDTTNNRSAVQTLVVNTNVADVSVSKSGPGTAIVGDTLVYVVLTRNLGTSNATDVVVTDTLPAGVTFVSATRAATFGAGVITWPAVGIANGAAVTDTVIAVAATVGTGTNIAAATSTSTDPDATNNDGSNAGARVTTVISPAADLAVGKTDGVTSVFQGGTVTYAIVVSNAGPNAVTGAVVTDAFPAGVSGVTWTCAAAGGASCAASGSGDLVSEPVDLPVGGSVTFTASGTVTGTGTLVNTATVAPPAGTVDPNAANNAATDNDTQIVILGVSVTPDGVDTLPRLPSNGTGYSYDFSVTNTSAAATSFDLLASAGAVVTVDSITGSGVTGGVQPDSARLANLAGGASAAVTVWYRVANALAGSLDSLYLLGRAVPVPAVRDSGWAFVRVVKPALTTVKGVVPGGTQAPGTDLTYTLVVRNTGTADAAIVTTRDSIPTELDFSVGSVAATLPPGITVLTEYSTDGSDWTYAPASLACGAPAGYDRCVRHIRWTLQQPLSAVAPANSATFEFVARIR